MSNRPWPRVRLRQLARRFTGRCIPPSRMAVARGGRAGIRRRSRHGCGQRHVPILTPQLAGVGGAVGAIAAAQIGGRTVQIAAPAQALGVGRSGWEFLGHGAARGVGLCVQRQYGARGRARRLRQCPGLPCIKKLCCCGDASKAERPHCAAQSCAAVRALVRAQAVRPVLSLRRRSGRQAWSACQPPAAAASGPGSSRPALRQPRRWACRWRWRSWQSWPPFRSRSAGSVR